jgi:hypothetical protein
LAFDGLEACKKWIARSSGGIKRQQQQHQTFTFRLSREQTNDFVRLTYISLHFSFQRLCDVNDDMLPNTAEWLRSFAPCDARHVKRHYCDDFPSPGAAALRAIEIKRTTAVGIFCECECKKSVNHRRRPHLRARTINPITKVG